MPQTYHCIQLADLIFRRNHRIRTAQLGLRSIIESAKQSSMSNTLEIQNGHNTIIDCNKTSNPEPLRIKTIIIPIHKSIYQKSLLKSK